MGRWRGTGVPRLGRAGMDGLGTMQWDIGSIALITLPVKGPDHLHQCQSIVWMKTFLLVLVLMAIIRLLTGTVPTTCKLSWQRIQIAEVKSQNTSELLQSQLL